MNEEKIYAEAIANEYSAKKTSRISALKKLDKKAKLGPSIFAYSVGITGALLLGIGMCLSMKVIGDNSNLMFILGIIIGVFGIVLVSINYPIYSKLLNKSKNKYASDIIRLADEIINEK